MSAKTGMVAANIIVVLAEGCAGVWQMQCQLSFHWFDNSGAFESYTSHPVMGLFVQWLGLRIVIPLT